MALALNMSVMRNTSPREPGSFSISKKRPNPYHSFSIGSEHCITAPSFYAFEEAESGLVALLSMKPTVSTVPQPSGFAGKPSHKAKQNMAV